MFTGIVEEIGTVRHVAQTSSGRRVEIGAERVLERLAVDDSINVGGTCLTVVARDDRSFTVDVVPETLDRTTLGRLARGSRVDLERAVTPSSSLGGHIVQGHVDVTTALVSRHAEGEGARLRFAMPKGLARYVVEKGFIAIDGVSLTIAAIAKTTFDVALIPHSAQRTTLGSLREGDLVNVEVDIIGKYVERLLDAKGA
jgi:riboflavin synthase